MALIPRNYNGYPMEFAPSARGYRRGYGNYGYYGTRPLQHQSNYQMTAPQFMHPAYQPYPHYDYGYGPYYKGAPNMMQSNKKAGLGTQFAMLVNDVERQLEYEAYMRRLRALLNNQQRLYTTQQPYVPRPIYQPQGSYDGPPIGYEREIRYQPYPVYITKPNLYTGRTTGALKYVIVPVSYPFIQPSMGPLTMPPFLFSRMAQPLCSLPLPPPLPPISYLPLAPILQQMVMQRYSNPVAVYPFASIMQNSFCMNNELQQQQVAMQAYQFNQFNRGFVPPPPQSMFTPQACMINQQQFVLPMIPMSSMVPPQQQQIMPIPYLPISQQQQIVPSPYLPISQQQQIVPSLNQSHQFISSSVSQPINFQQQITAPMIQPQELASSSLVPPVLSALSTPQQQIMAQILSNSLMQSMQPNSYLPSAPQQQITAPIIQPQQLASNPLTQPVLSALSTPQQQIMAQTFSNSLMQPSSYLPSAPQQQYGTSVICRACVPMPPPLNIPVNGNCWIQHCSCCHHIPNDMGNERRSGRVTPLLRHPVVPQFLPDPHQHLLNPPALLRPWLRKTPPLPPGSILLSDEYFEIPERKRKYRVSSWMLQPQRPNANKDIRSATSNESIHLVNIPGTNENLSPLIQRIVGEKVVFKPKEQELSELTNSLSSSTVSTEPDKHKKDELSSSRYRSTTVDFRNNNIPTSYRYHSRPKSKTRAAKLQTSSKMNPPTLHFNYYPPEVQSVVYTSNKYSKSSSENSTPVRTVTHKPIPEASNKRLDNILDLFSGSKEEEKNVLPMVNDEYKTRIIVIREYMNSSPSTISTISSNSSFNIIIDKNLAEDEQLSTVSTIIEESDNNSMLI